MIGVPIGRNLLTGSVLCCDPISWFERGRYISQPSAFVLGNPGLGKSTLVRRIALGLCGYGVVPLVLGDLKPDYVDLIRALGGRVIRLAPGRDHLNVLDISRALAASERLTGRRREELISDARQRRELAVVSLLTIVRRGALTDREEAVVERAMRVLDDRTSKGAPVLRDLLQVIHDAPDDVRAVTIDRGDLNRYRDHTEDLEATLTNLANGGRLGTMFSEQTTEQMELGVPTVFDVSDTGDDLDLQAAAMMASWTYGFGMVAVSNALADAGVGKQVHYMGIMDELWRPLRAGHGMVDRVDKLTRLNRQMGVGQMFITHTMKDLLSVPDPQDREKAKGFVERAGMVICGGLPSSEMEPLNEVVSMSRSEREMIVSWQTPPSWSGDPRGAAGPPGQGNFLVKVGGRPGIPVHVGLTRAELAVNETNKRWGNARHQGGEG